MRPFPASLQIVCYSLPQKRSLFAIWYIGNTSFLALCGGTSYAAEIIRRILSNTDEKQNVLYHFLHRMYTKSLNN